MLKELNEEQRLILEKSQRVSALLRAMEDLQIQLLALQVEVQFEQEALEDLIHNNKYYGSRFLARDLK